MLQYQRQTYTKS